MINLLVSSRSNYNKMVERLNRDTGDSFYFIGERELLCLDYLDKLLPEYVFFPHWSYLIPAEIHEKYECIIFHMTNLPFGRGGSPLQNLISRGIYETQITALRCDKGLDTGPIYCKRPLSLYGTAEEIYIRAANTIEEMIKWIIKNRPEPVSQEGESCFFPRRKPDESNIENLDSLEKLFDHIRMLDAEGYPHAFLETEYFRLEFERASLKPDYIKADVIIRKKDISNS